MVARSSFVVMVTLTSLQVIEQVVFSVYRIGEGENEPSRLTMMYWLPSPYRSLTSDSSSARLNKTLQQVIAYAVVVVVLSRVSSGSSSGIGPA